ncbi:MAG: polysaccharide deacetylase family protein [Actinomycetota bacterium]|nr:polysaccharide deacetylase family protein [Actinomycetota bacterium]
MRPWIYGGLGLTAAWCGPAAAPVVPPLAKALRIPLRIRHDSGVALTFDDGPHPQGTPAVLELLRAAGATATFFLVGEQVERWPAVAAEIAAAGHEIALHGHRHQLLLRRTPAALREDLDHAGEVIAAATGFRPTCYRPPYGVFSAGGLALVRRRGWASLLWSRWGRDWEARATGAGVARHATAHLRAGDVVLLHPV